MALTPLEKAQKRIINERDREFVEARKMIGSLERRCERLQALWEFHNPANEWSPVTALAYIGACAIAIFILTAHFLNLL